MLESHPILTYTIAPLRKEEVQANGHCLQNNHQGRDARVMVLHPSLVMFEHPPFDQIFVTPSVTLLLSPTVKEYHLPKTNFPRFDGVDPKLWKDKAEKYFRLFKVPAHPWSLFATVHLNITASLWFQTYEAQHYVDTRVELCVATLEVLQTPSVGEVYECLEESFFPNPYLVLELVYVLASCSIKK